MKCFEFTFQVFKSILVIAVYCCPLYANTGSAADGNTQNSVAHTGSPREIAGVSDLADELTVKLADIRTLASRGEYTQALSEIDQIIETTTGNPHPVFLKAIILESAGNSVAAAELYRELTITHPEFAEPFNNLAVHYMNTGDYESAIATLETAFEGHQGYATVFSNLQSIYDHLASNAYRKALNIEKPPDTMELVSLDQILQQPTSSRKNPVHVTLTAPVPTGIPGPEVPAAHKSNEIIVLAVAQDTDIRIDEKSPADESGDHRIGSVYEDNSTSKIKEQPITVDIPGDGTGKDTQLLAVYKPTEMHQIYAPELSDLSPLTRSDTATSQGLKATEYKSLSGDSRSALPDYSTDNETIRNRIDNWADAWSNRDLDRYLSYYSSEFVPRYNLTLDQWKKHQHALWRWRKLIVVELSDVSIDISGNDAIVKFTQHYKSNSFENTVGKTLELKQKNGSWYITREFI